MDDRDNQPPDIDEQRNSTSASSRDYSVKLINKDILEFHPRVADDLDLHFDLNAGIVLGRSASFQKRYTSSGLGMIGAISEESDDELTSLLGMPVKLDLISPHVLFVAGKRGSGKSYTLGIIAEELALAMERMEIQVAAVVIDTVDVFRQMVEGNEEQESLLNKWGLAPRGIPITVYIPRSTHQGLPDEVKTRARLYPLSISPSELSVADWGYVLEKGGQLSTTMDNLIGDVLDSFRRGYTLEDGSRSPPKHDFSIRDMISCIDSNAAIIDLYKPATRTAMTQRLRRAQRLGIFHPGGTSAQDLAVPGQITVIDVAPLGSDAETVLAILTNILCRQVLTYRMAWTDEGTSAREELPPTWLIIDEAHTLVPRSGETPAKEAIVSYAKLGRRFGCSLVLCTQQPSAVADEAISQSDIIISHALSHDADIRALQQRAPAVMPESLREKVFISSLPKGVALVFDQTTENKRGFITQIRPRLSRHGGTDRLSSLFAATSLMPPENGDIMVADTEIFDSEELSEPTPEFMDGLPEIPKPPLKLSREDWDALDGWIREYIQHLFERQEQEYAITDEPSPHDDSISDHPDISTRATVVPSGTVQEVEFDPSRVTIRRFGTISPSLLEKATVRKVLYSRVPHHHLFSSQKVHRSIVTFHGDEAQSDSLLLGTVGILLNQGLDLERIHNEDGFSFVLFSKNGTRVGLTAAMSESHLCVAVAITSEERREASRLANALRIEAED